VGGYQLLKNSDLIFSIAVRINVFDLKVGKAEYSKSLTTINEDT
jgi:hypothetical protein